MLLSDSEIKLFLFCFSLAKLSAQYGANFLEMPQGSAIDLHVKEDIPIMNETSFKVFGFTKCKT